MMSDFADIDGVVDVVEAGDEPTAFQVVGQGAEALQASVRLAKAEDVEYHLDGVNDDKYDPFLWFIVVG